MKVLCIKDVIFDNDSHLVHFSKNQWYESENHPSLEFFYRIKSDLNVYINFFKKNSHGDNDHWYLFENYFQTVEEVRDFLINLIIDG